MAQVWVRAKTILRVDENGKQRTVFPNDWCQMGRAQAKDYLAKGQIEILKPAVLQTVQDLTDCAILLKGSEIHDARRGQLATLFPGVPIEGWPGYPPKHKRFLVWDMSVNLRHDLILTGFGLLLKWQLAIPLIGYDKLAGSVGSPEEQEAAKFIIHDLRTPVYNPGVMFVRQCRENARLFELWDGSELGLLTAIYQSVPKINALPPSWIL